MTVYFKVLKDTLKKDDEILNIIELLKTIVRKTRKSRAQSKAFIEALVVANLKETSLKKVGPHFKDFFKYSTTLLTEWKN